MTALPFARPPGFPQEDLLVLTEVDFDSHASLVLGVFRSHEELLTWVAQLLTDRQYSFSLDDQGEEDSEGLDEIESGDDDDGNYVTFNAEEHEIELQPLPHDAELVDDLDHQATSNVFVVTPDGAFEPTGLCVWDSAKKWTIYAPLKLYWCTTPDGGEDWFIVSHTATQAALQHARGEGYNDEDANAEFIMNLPDELQGGGDDLLGWAQPDLLRTCGAKVVRGETPRVVELAGRTFSEGMVEHQILKMHDDQFESVDQGRPNRTRRSTPS